MKLYAYGDSWTEGEGTNWPIEQSFKDRKQLQLFRNESSWVNILANKLGLEPVNNGWSGKANNVIFNEVINDLRNGKIHKDDFVVIMWSSSLRDYLPFFPAVDFYVYEKGSKKTTCETKNIFLGEI
jgi:hypothetical protein